ncbi:MAG: hypothetical protein WAM60_06765 [Candidatus Promineifilaceae bacterium]
MMSTIDSGSRNRSFPPILGVGLIAAAVLIIGLVVLLGLSLLSQWQGGPLPFFLGNAYKGQPLYYEPSAAPEVAQTPAEEVSDPGAALRLAIHRLSCSNGRHCAQCEIAGRPLLAKPF